MSLTIWKTRFASYWRFLLTIFISFTRTKKLSSTLYNTLYFPRNKNLTRKISTQYFPYLPIIEAKCFYIFSPHWKTWLSQHESLCSRGVIVSRRPCHANSYTTVDAGAPALTATRGRGWDRFPQRFDARRPRSPRNARKGTRIFP